MSGMEYEPTNSGSVEEKTMEKVLVIQSYSYWFKGALDQFHACN